MRLSNEIKEHYFKVLDSLIDNHNYFKYYFQNPQSFFIGTIENGISITTGAFRGCIIDNAFDYVVKFSLDGDSMDGCEEEERIFTRALSQGFEDYFAEPIYLGCYYKTINYFPIETIDEYVPNGLYFYDEKKFRETEEEMTVEGESTREIEICIPLYAYPKAERAFMGYYHTSRETREIVNSNFKSPLSDTNENVAMRFVDDYGEEAYHQFSHFLNEEGVNDLHLNNVGLINGKLVLIDYAGA